MCAAELADPRPSALIVSGYSIRSTYPPQWCLVPVPGLWISVVSDPVPVPVPDLAPAVPCRESA